MNARFWLLVVVSTVCTACSVNGPYHTSLGNESVVDAAMGLTTVKNQKQSFFTVNCGRQPQTQQLGKDFYLGFVEFDNQGDFFNFDQLNELLLHLRRLSGHLLLITYVHGWQNNADVQGLGADAKDADVQRCLDEFKVNVNDEVGDVQRFKHFLAVLANIPSLKGVAVCGVYLGWRGELIENPSNDPVTKYAIMTVPRALTFWSREATATRMGDSSAFGITLQAIRAFAAEQGDRVTTVFMGHSFGAKILEQAVTQWALREFGTQLGKSSHPEKEHFAEPFGNMVLFMNPASQSIYARRLSQILNSYPDDYYRYPPLFIAVSSTSDYATGLAFPIGTTLGTSAGAYREFHDKTSQSSFFRSTSVNNECLRNGDIEVSPTKLWASNSVQEDVAPALVQSAEQKPDVQSVEDAIRALQFNFTHHTFTGDPGHEAAYDVFLAKGLVADINFESPLPVGQPRNRTRYWLLDVDPKIIDGHPDIWSYNAMNLYARLFRLCAENHYSGQ